MFLVDDGTEAIGFTACDSTQRLYDVNEIVLFDRELTNYGGYYNTQTSSFICPVDGMYLFTLVINAYNTDVQVLIMRNDVELTQTWARAIVELYNHGANMVVTECLAGDVVWPRVEYIGGSQDVIHGADSCYTTFSGVLIKTI